MLRAGDISPGHRGLHRIFNNPTESHPTDITQQLINRALRPFQIKTDDLKNLSVYCPVRSPLDFKPVYPTRYGIIVCQPGLIGTAIRNLLIKSCTAAGMDEGLHEALANAYTMHIANEIFLGSSAPPFEIHSYDSFFASQVVKKIDSGRYLHLLFFVDGFEGFESGGFIGIYPIEKISDFVKKSIDLAHNTYSAKDGFREGLTLVIGCGWGRSLGLVLGENTAARRTEMIPAYDATTLSCPPLTTEPNLLIDKTTEGIVKFTHLLYL